MKHGLIDECSDHFREMVKESNASDIAPSFVVQRSNDARSHPLRGATGITERSPRGVIDGLDGMAVNARVLGAVPGPQERVWTAEKTSPSRDKHRQLCGDHCGIPEHLLVQQYWARERSPSALVPAR